MSFIQEFFRLFYDPTVYRQVIHQKLKQSLGFFALFYLTFSLLVGLYLNLRIVPLLLNAVTEVGHEVVSVIPADAAFTFTQGKLAAAGIHEPLIIPAPTSLPLSVKNLFYLDTGASLTDLATRSALISFGATDARFISPDTAEVQVVNYTQERFNGTVTGNEIQTDINRFFTLMNQVKPFIPFLIALPLFIALLIARFIYTVLYTALFIFGSSLFGRKYSFTSFLNLTLHTIVVADTLNGLISVVYGHTYPLVFSIAFFGVTLFAYFNLPVTKTE